MTAARQHSSGAPVLLSADPAHRVKSAQTLSRACRRGELVRLATGVYTQTERWLVTAEWDRYLMSVVAHDRSRRDGAVFCHLTGILLHGLPLASTPKQLHVRATSPGRSGMEEAKTPYVNNTATFQQANELALRGQRRGPAGTLPMNPDIRRYANLLGHGAGRDQAQVKTVTLSDGTRLGEVHVDPLPAACASVLATEALRVSVPPADALARRSTAAFDSTLKAARQLLSTASDLRRFDEAAVFADRRSESVGESLSRALIHELGFEVPELQVQFRSPSGVLTGRVDFWWESIQLIGEFDGMEKYRSAQMRAGKTVDEVLVGERRRELDLAGPGRKVFRWMWKDLMNERAFEAQLTRYGVPRVR